MVEQLILGALAGVIVYKLIKHVSKKQGEYKNQELAFFNSLNEKQKKDYFKIQKTK